MNRITIIADNFVENIFHYSTIDSTNSLAKNVLDLPKHGLCVIWADTQSAGRGQRDNSFYSPLGGLYASLICPIADITKHFELNRAVSLAIRDAVAALCPGAALSIKWPNDIYWSGKKICGILLESTLHSTRHLVVGFGINVNGDHDFFPGVLRESATSMEIQTNTSFDIAQLLWDICRRFQTNRFIDPRLLHSIYVNSLFRRGSPIRIGGKQGIFETVLEDGRLCLNTGAHVEHLLSGSIEFIGETS
jgi:BirA family transcriptional regulator, biotin operon repressor / biotin---[acetyl-CoA-carboxylase] ligase